jgi:hypothetical protein
MRNIENNVMKTVKIKREELLAVVRENKEKHIVEFNESVEDFKKAVVVITKNNLKLVNTGDLNNIAKVKNLPSVPSSYEQSYTRAIRMLELSIDDVIELDDTTFNQLVLDEWNWKSNFQLSGSLYKSLM